MPPLTLLADTAADLMTPNPVSIAAAAISRSVEVFFDSLVLVISIRGL
mgnify:CR=1 FL=1